jgi:hypothetical protein
LTLVLTSKTNSSKRPLFWILIIILYNKSRKKSNFRTSSSFSSAIWKLWKYLGIRSCSLIWIWHYLSIRCILFSRKFGLIWSWIAYFVILSSALTSLTIHLIKLLILISTFSSVIQLNFRIIPSRPSKNSYSSFVKSFNFTLFSKWIISTSSLIPRRCLFESTMRKKSRNNLVMTYSTQGIGVVETVNGEECYQCIFKYSWIFC